jgi:hypothetical protein
MSTNDSAVRDFIQVYLDRRADGLTHEQIMAALPHREVAERQLKQAGIGSDLTYGLAVGDFLGVYRQARAQGLSADQILASLPNATLAVKQLKAAKLIN